MDEQLKKPLIITAWLLVMLFGIILFIFILGMIQGFMQPIPWMES